MDRLERETAAVLLEAAAINFVRWHSAYTEQFHRLTGDKLDEAIRAGSEARRQLYEAAHRYVGEPTMLAELVKALGWQGGTVHQVVAEVRRLRSQANYKGAYERACNRIIELIVERDAALSVKGEAPTAPGLERP